MKTPVKEKVVWEDKKSRSQERKEKGRKGEREKLHKRRREKRTTGKRKRRQRKERDERQLKEIKETIWKANQKRKAIRRRESLKSSDSLIYIEDDEEEGKAKSMTKGNKFVYTKAQSRVIGQEQLCPKIMKKMKFWTFWTFLKI